jgi:hypothetical protein
MSLPVDFPAFDHATISDVIVHIRYTARAGVQTDKVKTALTDLFAEVSAASGANLALLFSLPHDYPSEWSTFVNGQNDFAVSIGRDYFPYFAVGQPVTLLGFEFYGGDGKHHAFGDPAARTNDLQGGAFTLTSPPDGAGPTQVLTRTPGKQVYLVVRYSLG